jgi:Ca-activated chloride channel family protein
VPELRFVHPYAFLLLVPVALFVLRRFVVPGSRAVVAYSDTRLLAGLPVGWRIQLRRLPAALYGAAALALIIAMARPQAGIGRFTSLASGVDTVFTIDISDSMARADFNGLPRLEAARMMIRAFIQDRPSDRIGLVTFANDAFLLSPPTLDHTLLLEILDSVTYASSQELSTRTALGMGIAAAARLLANSSATSRVILLVTDGASNTGLVDPLTAARAAAALGLRVHTVGLGVAGQGSELDEDTLREVAAIAGGRYFQAQAPETLAAIYTTIDNLEKDVVSRTVAVEYDEIAHLFVATALVALAVGKLLERTLFQAVP